MNEVEIVVTSRDKSAAGFDAANKRAEGFRGSMQRIGEAAAGFLSANVIGAGVSKLTDFIGGSVKAASDLGESMNAVTKIFGSQQDVIFNWGKTQANSFGLSQRAFNELAVPLGAGLKNAGLNMTDVSGKTIDLTKRAADMASVFNTDVGDALEAIQAGLRGEADPLERYGVSLTAAAVQAEALSETHKKSAKELTNQELALARVNLIMKQTQSSAGDFASTSDQLANSQRIAAAKTEELQAKIGQKMIPVMKLWTEAKLKLVGVIADKLLPGLERLGDWMSKNQEIVGAIAAVVLALLVPAFIAWAASATAAAVATIAATWPLIAIVGAIAAVVAGVIYAYKHWQWFHDAVQAVAAFFSGPFMNALRAVAAWFSGPFVQFFVSAWETIKSSTLQVVNFIGNVWQGAKNVFFSVFSFIVNTWLWVVGQLVNGAAKAFGWVPGIGDKLQHAAAEFNAFKDRANSALNQIRDRNVQVRIDEIHRQIFLDPVGHFGPNGTGGPPARASGGIIGAASGGVRSRLTWVGEHGRELVDLAPGSRVHSNADSERMAGQAGGSATSGVTEVRFSGDTDTMIATLFMKLMREGKILIRSSSVV